MNKYISVFKISFQQEFAYKLNFVMWRVRNVLQIFLVFFLWDAVFSDNNRVLFGYDKAKILTYVFGILIVRAFVLSSRTVDVVGEVARGDLSNYLVKPVNYFKYWLTRDFSSKALNLSFVAIETVVLFVLLRPPLFIQTNPFFLLAFATSIVLAILIFFTITFINGSVPFWYPEAAWGVNFIVLGILVEFLSGGLFPLDVLPSSIQSILSFTPFPYLIFFPIQVYLGKMETVGIVKGLGVSAIWLVILWFSVKYIWGKGLKVYQSQGR
jgi:ABC-2 type transport system permease protein